MNQRMPGRSSLNFPQSGKIASFEIAISVLKFPQGGFGRSGMKDVTDCPKKRSTFSVGRISTHRANLYEIRTCSADAQKTKYWYA